MRRANLILITLGYCCYLYLLALAAHTAARVVWWMFAPAEHVTSNSTTYTADKNIAKYVINAHPFGIIKASQAAKLPPLVQSLTLRGVYFDPVGGSVAFLEYKTSKNGKDDVTKLTLKVGDTIMNQASITHISESGVVVTQNNVNYPLYIASVINNSSSNVYNNQNNMVHTRDMFLRQFQSRN